MENTDAITIIKQNIIRCISDRFPGYDHDVAIYNDLLRRISPEHAFIIEYDGQDCKLVK